MFNDMSPLNFNTIFINSKIGFLHNVNDMFIYCVQSVDIGTY